MDREDKRKMKLDFKVKHLLINALSYKEFFYVFNCDSANEVWGTFEMIHDVSASIEQERINT